MSLGFHYHSEGFCDLLARRENEKGQSGAGRRFGGHFVNYNFASAGKGDLDNVKQKSFMMSWGMLIWFKKKNLKREYQFNMKLHS